MKYPGIPTTYAGVVFRSRLEAKWARFFDLVGWPWQYEPYDLAGWIPDFLLLGKYPTLVEVKPVMTFPERVADKIDWRCRPHLRGLEGLNDQEVLILGCTFLNSETPRGKRPLGWLRENGRWDLAYLGTWTDAFTLGFCHSTGSPHDRMSGDVSRRGPNSHSERYILGLWAEAANATQWQGQETTGEFIR